MIDLMAFGRARKIIFPSPNTDDGRKTVIFLCLPYHYPDFTGYSVYRQYAERQDAFCADAKQAYILKSLPIKTSLLKLHYSIFLTEKERKEQKIHGLNESLNQ